MKKLFLSFIVLGALSLSGCVYLLFPSSMHSLSLDENERPFYGLIGKEVNLQRPVKVYEDIFWSGLEDKEADSVVVGGAITKMTYIDANGNETITRYYRIPKNLHKGTVIKFDTASFFVDKDYAFFIPYKIRYVASFHVINNPDISKKLKFRYIWGRGLYIHRAPWEDDKVPETRYVGFSGKGYEPK